MIQKFVTRFDAARPTLLAKYKAAHPHDYAEIVADVVRAISVQDDYASPDPERVHEIDWGDYQGTLVFVIGARGYQPDKFWYVTVGYGSCSGCDTLQGIAGYIVGLPTDQQASDYLTLALHVVQEIREMYPQDGGT